MSMFAGLANLRAKGRVIVVTLLVAGGDLRKTNADLRSTCSLEGLGAPVFQAVCGAQRIFILRFALFVAHALDVRLACLVGEEKAEVFSA